MTSVNTKRNVNRNAVRIRVSMNLTSTILVREKPRPIIVVIAFERNSSPYMARRKTQPTISVKLSALEAETMKLKLFCVSRTTSLTWAMIIRIVHRIIKIHRFVFLMTRLKSA